MNKEINRTDSTRGREPYLYRSTSGPNVAGDVELGNIKSPSNQTLVSHNHQDFSQEAESIQRSIDRISFGLRNIDQLHSRALNSVSPDEALRFTSQVEQAQEETNKLIQDTRNRLQVMAHQTSQLQGREVRVRKVKQGVLAKNLMNAVEKYQKIQEKSKRDYRKKMEREIRIVRPDATQDEINKAIDSRNGPIFAQEILSSRINEQRRVLKEVQGRHAELRRIENSIEELVNLYQEMQLLIETQQEMIETIDKHVEDTNHHMVAASSEVTKAIDYRKKSRKKLWWVVLLVVILLIILAIVLYIYVIKPALDNQNQKKN